MVQQGVGNLNSRCLSQLAVVSLKMFVVMTFEIPAPALLQLFLYTFPNNKLSSYIGLLYSGNGILIVSVLYKGQPAHRL